MGRFLGHGAQILPLFFFSAGPNPGIEKTFFLGGKLPGSNDSLGASKNRGTPQWMVYNGKPYEQIHNLGVPLFLEIPIWKREIWRE